MRHLIADGRFPAHRYRASIPWRGAKEVSGVALVVAQEVPTSSVDAEPGPPGLQGRRRRRRADGLAAGAPLRPPPRGA
ncbi:hypothetical protein AB0C60_28825, partial [Streptomyces sp. NPDC048845]